MQFPRALALCLSAAFFIFISSNALALETTDDHNAGIQYTDANVHLTCSAPGGNCSAIFYRLDSDQIPLGYLWFNDLGRGMVYKYNRTTNTREADISIAIYGPNQGAADNNNNYWFFTNQSSQLRRINPLTNTVQATISSGFDLPNGIVIDANGNVWVANYAGSSVSRLNPLTNTVTATISVGASPQGIAVDANGNVWVGMQTGRLIYRINPANNTVSTPLVTNDNMGCFAADFNGNVWVTTLGAAGFVRIDTYKNSVDANISTGGYSCYWRGCAVDINNNVWLSCNQNVIARINPFTNSTTIISDFNNPYGLAVDANQNVWVGRTQSKVVSRIDPATNKTDFNVTLPGPYTGSDIYSSGDFTGYSTRAQFMRYDKNILLSTDGNHKIEYYSVDQNGIREAQVNVAYAVINKNPVTTSSLVPDANSFSGDANITLSCSDPLNGCYATYYRLDGNDSLAAPYPYLWVTNTNATTVSKINPINNSVVATINVGDGPLGAAVDANGNVWVANQSSNNVSRIDPLTNSVVATIAISGSTPRGIAVDSNSNIWVNSNGFVSRINPANNSIVAIATISGGAYYFAIDANQNVWAVKSLIAGIVVRINPITNTVDANIAVGSYPEGIAVDSNNNVWVANTSSNSISRINPFNNKVDFNIAVSFPSGIAVDANQNLWITRHSGPVYRINPITKSIVATINFNSTIGELAVDANQNVWVAFLDGNSISRINPNTNKIDANISIGSGPYSMGDFTGFALQNFVLGKGWKSGSSDASGWKVDSNGWKQYGGLNDANIFVDSLNPSNWGSHKLEYYSIDNNGQVEAVKTSTFTMARPVITVDDHNAGIQYSDANVHLTCLSYPKPCSTTYYRLDSDKITQGPIWITNYNSVTISRIDPATNSVVATITGGTAIVSAAVDLNGNVWFGNYVSGAWSVSRIDPATNSIVATTSALAGGPRIAIDANGNVWAAASSNVYRIDPKTNSIVATITGLATSSPGGIVVDANQNVWVDSDWTSAVARINPTNNTVTYTYTSSTRNRSIAAGFDGNVWAISLSNSISRIDTYTGSTDLNATTGTGSVSLMYGAVDANNNPWISDYYNKAYRINPYNAAVISTTIVGMASLGYPLATAIDANQYVWVTLVSESKVSRINPSTALVDVNVAVGSSPQPYGDFTGYALRNQFKPYDKNILISADGNYKLEYYSVDMNGNAEAVKAVWVVVDKSPTTTSDANSSWQNTDANVHLTCTDLVGCHATYYRVDGTDSLKAPYPYVWVANYGSNKVSRINPITNNIDANITVGSSPIGVAVDANQNVWVTNYGSGNVSRIDSATSSVVATVSVGTSPYGVAVDANQNVWVANNGSSNVSRINPLTNSVVATISTNSVPRGVAVDANQNVWVAHYGSNTTVSRINPATNNVDANVAVGSSTMGIAVDSNGNVWAAATGSNSVSRINPQTNSVVATIAVGASTAPQGIAVDANQNVWVAHYNSKVSRISPLNNSVVATITVGSNPIGIAADANGNIWVGNGDSDSVSRINPQTNSVVATVIVGDQPYSLGDMTGFALQNFVLKKGYKSGSSDASGWKIDSNGWKQYGGLNDSNILISTDGNHRLEYYSIDRNGNVEAANTKYVPINKPPVTTSDAPSGVQSNDVNVHLTCTDQIGGCYATYYRLDGSDDTLAPYPALWFALNSNGNWRYDPDTNAITKIGTSNYTYYQSVPGPDQNIWTGFYSIYAINPKTNLVTTINSVSAYYVGFAFDLNKNPWVSAWGPTRLARINPYNGSFLSAISGMYNTTNAYFPVIDKNNNLWYGDTTDSRIYRYDINSNRVVTRIQLQSPPYGLALDYNQNIWAVSPNLPYVYKIDTSLNKIVNSISTGIASSPNSIAIDANNNIWVGNSAATVYRINPDINAVVATIPVIIPSASSSQGLGVMLDANQNVWVINRDSSSGPRVVARINPRTNKVDQNLTITTVGSSDSFRENINSSGVPQNYFSFPAGWKMYAPAGYDANILVSTDGNHKLEFYSRDVNGNAESLNTIYVTVNKSGPVTKSDINNNSWQFTDANIHLYCEGAVGCASTKYRLDSDPTAGVSMGGWLAYDKNILISSSGNFAVDFNSTDSQGKIEATKTQYVIIEKQAPSTSDDHNAGWQDFSSRIHLSCSDSNSGCARTYFKVDGLGMTPLNSVWVPNYGTTTVSRLDAATNTVLATISIGQSNLNAVAIDSDKNVWVAGPYGYAYRINSRNNSVSPLLGVGSAGYSGSTIYQAAADTFGNMWFAGGGTIPFNLVSRVDINKYYNISDIIVDSQPYGIAVDANGFVWAANYGGNSVSKISPSSNSVVAVIMVGTQPSKLAVDGNGFIWVVNTGSNTVSRINPITSNVDVNVTGFSSPQSIAVAPNGYIWVTNGTSTISRINPLTNLLDLSISGFSSPRGISVDFTGNLWVANYGNNTVSKVNPATGAISSITVGTTPVSYGDMTGMAFAISQWGIYDNEILLDYDGNHRIDYYSVDNAGNAEPIKTVWQATDLNAPTTSDDRNTSTGWLRADSNIHLSCFDNGVGCYATYYRIDGNDSLTAPYGAIWTSSYFGNFVSRIDPLTNSVVATLTGFSGAHGIAVDANGRAWVSNPGSNYVSVINPATNTIDANITVGTQPRGIAIDANNNAWVANAGSSSVSRIDGRTNTVVKTITGVSAFGIAVDGNQNVWVTSQGTTLSRIDPNLNSVVATITVGNNSWGVAADLNGNIWVANNSGGGAGGTVSRIDPNLNAVSATITGFSGTTSVAVDSNNNVWVTSQGTALSRINPVNNTVTTMGVGGAYGVAVDANQNVWVAGTGSSLVKLNPVNGSTVTISGFSNNTYGSGDFTGFALQNIVMSKGWKAGSNDQNGWKVDSNGWKQYGGLNDANILITDGNHKIEYYSIDRNRHVESVKSFWAAVDKTFPVTTDDALTEWYANDANIHLSCSEATTSCYATYYRIDNNDGVYAPYPDIWSVNGINATRISAINNSISASFALNCSAATGMAIDRNNYLYVPQNTVSCGGYTYVISRVDLRSNTLYSMNGLSYYWPSYVAAGRDLNIYYGGQTNLLYRGQTNTLAGNSSGSISISAQLTGIAADMNNNIWVTVPGSNAVSRFNATPTLALVATISVGSSPYGVAVDNNNVWVANYGSATVSKVNPATNAVATSISVGTNPYGLAVDSNFNVWVVNSGVSPPSVSRINPVTNYADFTITGFPSSSRFIAIDANQNPWVLGSGTASKINPLNHKIDLNIANAGGGGLGDFTGFALQNFTLPNGWKMYGGLNDKNVMVRGDGNHRLDYYSIDRAYNTEAMKTAWVLVESAPPTTTLTPKPWYFPPARPTLSCYDAGSGCQSTAYRLDTDPSSASNSSSKPWLYYGEFSADGNTALMLHLNDKNLGNWVGDVSGNDNNGYLGNGTAANMPTLSSSAGKFGKGLDFNATNTQFVQVAHKSPSLDLNDSFTIEGWFKVVQGAATKTMMTTYQTGSGGFFLVHNNANKLVFQLYDTTDLLSSQITSPNAITDANWHHVAIVRDKNSQSAAIFMYIDAIPVASNSGASTFPATVTGSTLFIGKSSISPANPFNGSMDEIRIKKNALTPLQVLDDYNGSSIVISSDGNYQIDYNSTDNVGHIEDTKTGHINVVQGTFAFNKPAGGETYTGKDGNILIDFNFANPATNYMNVKFYYSTAPGSQANLIRDMNLAAMALSPTADANCAGGGDFSVVRQCFAKWDINIMATSTPSAMTDSGSVWIANSGSATASRISSSTNAVTATINVQSLPYGVAVDSNNNAWIVNGSSASVSRIDPSSNTVVATIGVGTTPRGIAIDANQNVWVANYANNNVSRINPATNTVLTTVSVGSSPAGITIDRSQNVWVTNYNGPTVSRIDPSSNAVSATVTGFNGPYNLAADSNGNIWVGNINITTVSRINPLTNTIVATVTGFPANPNGIAIDANQNIWVANYNGNSVSRVNPATNSILTSITVGSNPYGVSVSADQNIWVANYSSSTVSKISPTTNSVIATINVGSNPYAVGDMTGFALSYFTMATVQRVPTGNYYLDANLYDPSNSLLFSSNQFRVNNSATLTNVSVSPSTSFWGNTHYYSGTADDPQGDTNAIRLFVSKDGGLTWNDVNGKNFTGATQFLLGYSGFSSSDIGGTIQYKFRFNGAEDVNSNSYSGPTITGRTAKTSIRFKADPVNATTGQQTAYVDYSDMSQPDLNTLLVATFDSGLNADFAVGSTASNYSGASIDSNGLDKSDLNLSPTGWIAFPTQGNFDTNHTTIEFWFKPNWNGNDGNRYTLFAENSLKEYSSDANSKVLLHFNDFNFDNWTPDASPNRNDAQLGSGISGQIPTRVKGRWGYGYSFDGGDVIEVPYNSSFDYGNTDQFTLEFWMKNSSTYSAIRNFLQKANSYGVYSTATNGLGFSVGDGTGNNSWDTNISIPTDGKWHHYAFTASGGTARKAYLDGNLLATNSNAYTIGALPITSSLKIGNGTNAGIIATLDEVRVSDKARSDLEVRSSARNPNSFAIWKDSDNKLYAEMVDFNAMPFTMSSSASLWSAGQWHHIALALRGFSTGGCQIPGVSNNYGVYDIGDGNCLIRYQPDATNATMADIRTDTPTTPSPDGNANGGTGLLRNYNGEPPQIGGRGLFKYDLSPISGKTITDANFSVYIYTGAGSDSNLATWLYDTNTNWYEGNVTWNNQPPLVNRLTNNIDVVAGGTAYWPIWIFTAAGRTTLQSWASTPSSNYGFFLKGDWTSGGGPYRNYYAPGWSTASQRPVLSIKFLKPSMGTYYGSPAAYLYLDGSLAGSLDLNSLLQPMMTSKDSNLYLGSDSNKYNNADGFFDEFRVSSHDRDQNSTGYYASSAGNDILGADVNIKVWDSNGVQQVNSSGASYSNGSYNVSFDANLSGSWRARADAGKAGYNASSADRNFSVALIPSTITITESSDPLSALTTETITVDYNASAGGILTDANVQISWDGNATWTGLDGNGPYTYSAEFLTTGLKSYTVWARKANYETKLVSGTISVIDANSTLTAGVTINPVMAGTGTVIHATYKNSLGTNLGNLAGTSVKLTLTAPGGSPVYSNIDMNYNSGTQRNEYLFDFNNPKGVWQWQVNASRGGDSKLSQGTLTLVGPFVMSIEPDLLASYESGQTIGTSGYVRESPEIGVGPIIGADVNVSLWDLNGTRALHVTGLVTDGNGYYSTSGIVAPDLESTDSRSYYVMVSARKDTMSSSITSSNFAVSPRATTLTTSASNTESDSNTMVQAYYKYGPSPITDANVRAVFMTNNMAGYWAFDSSSGASALDYSGNDMNGTLKGFSCLTLNCDSNAGWQSDANQGNSIGFDGATKYVEVPHDSSLGITSNLTISAWVKPSNASGIKEIIVKESGSGTASVPYMFGMSNAALQFLDANSGSGATANSVGLTIPAGVWSQVAVRRYGRQVTFFLNGTPYPADGNSALSPATNSAPVKFGLRDDNAYKFAGRIDEVQLWGRALSDNEVNSIYLNGASELLGYDSGISGHSASYIPMASGTIYYKAYASRSGYQKKVASSTFTASEHATIGLPFAPSFMDMNSTTKVGIAYKCNNSPYCGNNSITGADVNLVARDSNGNVFLTATHLDYNSFASRYEHPSFTPTSYGVYRLDFNASKPNYATDQNTVYVTVKKLDVNASLYNLHALPNETLAGNAFGVRGQVKVLPDDSPDYNALVTATINSVPFTAYTDANGNFDLNVTAPGTRASYNLAVTASDANGLSGRQDLNVFVRAQSTSLVMTGNIYKTDSVPQAQTAKPGESVTVTFSVKPISERATDMNVSLAFTDWNYGSDANASPAKFNYPTTDANSTDANSFTFTVPNREGGGYKNTIIRAQWRDENGGIGRQDYNLATGFGDRNVLFIIDRKAIAITASLDTNVYSLNSTATVHYTVTPAYNAPTVLNYYRADYYDINGSLIATINNYTTPQILQVNQSITVDANFNTGATTGAKYVRVKANYYDEFSNVQNTIVDLNLTIATILVELNLNKTKYNLSDSIGVSGRLSTLQHTFDGYYDLNIVNYLGNSIAFNRFSGLHVTPSQPYDYAHTFAPAGRGTFTAVGKFFDTNTGTMIETASKTFLQGVVGISINSMPARTYLGSLIDVNVHVSGVNGDNATLASSDFNVWDQNGTTYPLLNFSNQANGDYFFRIRMPSSRGTYTLTFQVTEIVSGLSSVSYVQSTLEVLNHSYTIDVSLGSNYQDYNFLVPGYVDRNISSVSTQSISAYPGNLDYYLAYRKSDQNLFGMVSTGGAPFLDVTSVAGTALQLSYTQIFGTAQTYFYFVTSKGGRDAIADRLSEITGGTFLERVAPAFGFGSPDEQTITAGLDYNKSSILIASDLNIRGGGDYTLVVKNLGRDGNRTRISVTRS